MADSSSFPCKRANENHDGTDPKKPKIMPASNGSILQPQHTRSENCSLQEELYIKKAQSFLVLKGKDTLAAGIISRSDLQNLPPYLLDEFDRKSWYSNHDLCTRNKGLEDGLTYYRFYKVLTAIKWKFSKRDVFLQTKSLQAMFPTISYSEITSSINTCMGYQSMQKLHEEKVKLYLQLWDEVALKKRDFNEVLRSIYETKRTSFPATIHFIELEFDGHQSPPYIKETFEILCEVVRSATGLISKGEACNQKISEFFEMIKPKSELDSNAKEFKAKIQMNMDLGIITKEDLLAIPGGKEFLKEASITRGGDFYVLSSPAVLPNRPK